MKKLQDVKDILEVINGKNEWIEEKLKKQEQHINMVVNTLGTLSRTIQGTEAQSTRKDFHLNTNVGGTQFRLPLSHTRIAPTGGHPVDGT